MINSVSGNSKGFTRLAGRRQTLTIVHKVSNEGVASFSAQALENTTVSFIISNRTFQIERLKS